VKTKKCRIVEKKPTTTTEVTILGSSFKARTEAESGMKTEKICTTNLCGQLTGKGPLFEAAFFHDRLQRTRAVDISLL
jgi:hypothetical protein